MRTPSQRTERALLLVDVRKQDALWEDGRHHNRLPSTGEDTAYNHQGDTLVMRETHTRDRTWVCSRSGSVSHLLYIEIICH
jgi:hypothetical protein